MSNLKIEEKSIMLTGINDNDRSMLIFFLRNKKVYCIYLLIPLLAPYDLP